MAEEKSVSEEIAKVEEKAAKPEVESARDQQEQAQDSGKTEADPAPVKKRSVRKRAPKKQEVSKPVKSKRKNAVARASWRDGTGRIRINGFDINIFEPIELRKLMLEPIGVSERTSGQMSRIDIKVNVYGGGPSSQAQAVRGVIAKSIVDSSGQESVQTRSEYMLHDRSMVVDDARRVEPKKFKGPKARARFQKSYR